MVCAAIVTVYPNLTIQKAVTARNTCKGALIVADKMSFLNADLNHVTWLF